MPCPSAWVTSPFRVTIAPRIGFPIKESTTLPAISAIAYPGMAKRSPVSTIVVNVLFLLLITIFVLPLSRASRQDSLQIYFWLVSIDHEISGKGHDVIGQACVRAVPVK